MTHQHTLTCPYCGGELLFSNNIDHLEGPKQSPCPLGTFRRECQDLDLDPLVIYWSFGGRDAPDIPPGEILLALIDLNIPHRIFKESTTDVFGYQIWAPTWVAAALQAHNDLPEKFADLDFKEYLRKMI